MLTLLLLLIWITDRVEKSSQSLSNADLEEGICQKVVSMKLPGSGFQSDDNRIAQGNSHDTVNDNTNIGPETDIKPVVTVSGLIYNSEGKSDERPEKYNSINILEKVIVNSAKTTKITG